MNNKSRVLIAPLNWGLGHASRCIPIINRYINNNYDVVIASDGEALSLLRKEFPNQIFEELPSYDISYPNKKNILWHLASMSKKILKNVEVENDFLKLLQNRYNFDLIISDNRPGIYHKGVFSIYITHQMNLKAKSISFLANKVNNHYMKRFNEIWIPDYKGERSLAGELSMYNGPLKTKYIGPLSRFECSDKKIIKDKLLIILSGPEPQRSILEEIILEKINAIETQVVFVRGVVEKHEKIKKRGKHIVYNFLTSDKLQKEICKADLVVSRSGYSTIMDLHALEKKAFFIPTPGQTEQEYLARFLKERKVANYINQSEFDISEVFELSQDYKGFKKDQFIHSSEE